MTTNKPEVVAYHHINKENPELRGVSLHHDTSCTNTLVTTEPLVRLSDYEALQADLDRLLAECLFLWDDLMSDLSARINGVSRRSLDGSVIMSNEEWNDIVKLIEKLLNKRT